MHACRHRPSPNLRQPGPSPLLPAHRAPAVPRRHPCLAPLPAPLGLRFRVLLGLGFVPPPEPRPCAHRAPPPASPLALRRPRALGWQESHRMHPFFAECAREALLLATSARNACFSRSRWQHLRPMHPFPGAIGRFRIHGVRILPPRALFRVEEPEITHDAKMLPAPPGLSAAAACGPAEWALRPAARAWPACRMRPPCHLACARRSLRPCHLARVHRRRLMRVALRPPRAAHADASRYLRAAPTPPAARAHRVQETSGTAQTTQCGHKNRIPK